MGGRPTTLGRHADLPRLHSSLPIRRSSRRLQSRNELTSTSGEEEQVRVGRAGTRGVPVVNYAESDPEEGEDEEVAAPDGGKSDSEASTIVMGIRAGASKRKRRVDSDSYIEESASLLAKQAEGLGLDEQRPRLTPPSPSHGGGSPAPPPWSPITVGEEGEKSEGDEEDAETEAVFKELEEELEEMGDVAIDAAQGAETGTEISSSKVLEGRLCAPGASAMVTETYPFVHRPAPINKSPIGCDCTDQTCDPETCSCAKHGHMCTERCTGCLRKKKPGYAREVICDNIFNTELFTTRTGNKRASSRAGAFEDWEKMTLNPCFVQWWTSLTPESAKKLKQRTKAAEKKAKAKKTPEGEAATVPSTKDLHRNCDYYSSWKDLFVEISNRKLADGAVINTSEYPYSIDTFLSEWAKKWNKIIDENEHVRSEMTEDLALDFVRYVLTSVTAPGEKRKCYWSFCHGTWVESSSPRHLAAWHCLGCGTCQDWQKWHCGRCDKCVNGEIWPCSGCGGVNKGYHLTWAKNDMYGITKIILDGVGVEDTRDQGEPMEM